VPKIKQESYKVGGEDFVCIYKVDSSGTFSCNVPAGLTRDLKIDKIEGRMTMAGRLRIVQPADIRAEDA